jgi:hypothetical protein
MAMSITSVKAQVTQALDTLNELELQQVADYVTFLRFRVRLAPVPVIDISRLGTLYAECADEDRAFAERGLDEYHANLQAEDHQ